MVLFTCGMPIRSKVYPGELQTFCNIFFGMFDESLKNLQFAEVANISKRLYSLYCGDGRGKNSRPAHAALGEPERVLANSKNPTLLSVPFFRDTTIWDTTILSNSKKDYREPELVLSSSKNPTLSWVYHSFGTPPFGWLEMSWMHRRWPNLFLLVLWPTNRRKDDNFFCTLLREGVKKTGKKRSGWPLGSPPPPPPPKQSGKCKKFSTSCHIWGYFAIL